MAGKGSNRRPGKGFEDNFATIFGHDRVERGSYVQHPETGKLIPREEYVRPSNTEYPSVHGQIETFVSPIDGSVISDRSHLREHNKKHGVTDSRDYSPEFMAKRSAARESELKGTTRQAKAERVELIKEKLWKAGIR